MMMLEDCIDKIFEKADLTDSKYDRELSPKADSRHKSIYYHLCDYKGVLDKSIQLGNEIENISNRWNMLGDCPPFAKKANKN